MATGVEKVFEEAGAVLEGHFLLSSGLHSPHYWEKLKVLQYPPYTELLCGMIASRFRKDRVQVVAGPTLGGIIIAFEVARQLGVRGVFAERENGLRVFRRGFEITPGERVLLVDDVVTTGKSLAEMLTALEAKGAKTVGAGILVDRSTRDIDIGVPLYSCLRVAAVTYQPETCPLCAAGLPLTKPGSRPLPA